LERNGVLVEVEVGWIFSHEDITDNEVVEASWEVHGLDTEEAFGLSELGNLENVVLGGKWIVLSVHGETDVWKGIEVLATGVDGDTGDEFVDEGFWTDEEGSSRVDDGLDVTGWDDGASLVDGVELEGPVFLFNDLMGLNDGVVLGVHTWDDHVGFSWVGVEVEREGFVFKGNLIHESWEFINRDGVISKTNNTAHLGGEERGS